jgi:hypothetical protein
MSMKWLLAATAALGLTGILLAPSAHSTTISAPGVSSALQQQDSILIAAQDKKKTGKKTAKKPKKKKKAGA